MKPSSGSRIPTSRELICKAHDTELTRITRGARVCDMRKNMLLGIVEEMSCGYEHLLEGVVGLDEGE